MAIGEIRVGQILPLIFIVKDQDNNLVPLQAASSKTVTIITANNGRKVFPAAFVTNGADGQIQYVTKNEEDQVDLDNVGPFKAQGKVIIAGIEYPSDIMEFEVMPNL